MKSPRRNIALDMTLSAAEIQSPAWLSMKAKFQARLDQLRIENDNPVLTDVETATLRGHIKCLKAVIALDKVPPKLAAAQPALANTARVGSRS